ncbi:ArnT family glycosyltransferase [Pseudomonas japonica]|uniref:ArnT family glycosyltransferase n=1 Tax=Pseudomonas japonica TaxID=256466 RepID=UPI0015E31AF8|nr:glycosyltransferase family 39 protein [Pseudomonas japonica]MBA1243753.1 glycosyltransferase family 39 protein [Pseudomonas japonica]
MPIKHPLLSMRWATVGLALLLLLLFFWALGSLPFMSVNEARRAVATREMHDAGSWLIPYMNGQPYLSKPPLFYWLALIVVKCTGSLSEWTLRLPSALFASLCCALLYWQVRKAAGQRLALFAVCILATNASFSLFARRAEIEMVLTGLCLMSILCAWKYIFAQGRRRWVWCSYALLGSALLTKGPVCLLWVTAPVLVYALLTKDTRAFGYLRSGPGWAAMLVIGSSWYIAVGAQQGWGVWGAVVQEDIVKKIDGQGAEPWYAYLLYLAGDFSPFWPILLIRPRRLWLRLRNNPAGLMLLCHALFALALFSCFTEKHAKYLLPVYPAIAVLLAYQWDLVWSTTSTRWAKRALVLVPIVTLVGYVIFYSTVEGRVFAHRVAGFRQIEAQAQKNPGVAAYSLETADMRLVYYMGRPITVLSEQQAVLPREAPALLFVRGALRGPLQALAPCSLAAINPYLKRNRSAVLVGLGSLCGQAPRR